MLERAGIADGALGGNLSGVIGLRRLSPLDAGNTVEIPSTHSAIGDIVMLYSGEEKDS